MLDSILPSKANPEHRAHRKALEQEHSFDNLKSMGLKAGVLALMAGLALYPKISAEVDVIEREQRMKKERKEIFKKRERNDKKSAIRGSGASDRGGYRDRDGGRREVGRRERGDIVAMRADEYDTRRSDGHRSRSEGDRRRTSSPGDHRDRRWEEASTTSAESSRTQDWVDGRHEYLNADNHRERSRKRW